MTVEMDPVVDTPPVPHSDEPPAWARKLQDDVAALTSKVEMLSPLPASEIPAGGVPEEEHEQDSKPISVPWTHRNPMGHGDR